MKIGIAGPISIQSLQAHLSDLTEEHLPLGLGGTAVNNLIHGLLQQGHDVSAYSLDGRIRQPLCLQGPHLKVFLGEYRNPGRRRMLDFFHQEATQIKDFILADQPDIVNAHWTYEYAIGAIRATDRHLLTFRDDAWEILKFQRDPYRLIRYVMDWWVRRKGKHFNVNSPYLQEIVSLPKERLPIVPNPVNEAYISPQGKPYPQGRAIRIVALINGWIARKNPEASVVAFQQLQQQESVALEYHIYGRDCGPEQAGSQWVRSQKLDRNVFFHGVIEHAMLMEVLPAYDILLHPALEESFGNTLIEAMGCGLPIVAGQDAGAVPWVLNGGKNGVLVDVTSPSAMAAGLSKLIHDKGLYEQLSQDGLAWVNQMFSAKNVAQQYVKLYQEIINKSATF
jgi:glycosyltransferase involved in cell wall biosynthesis